MHRIDGAGHQNNLFTEGDPQTATPATTVTDDWLNAYQEELCYVIEQAGITLNKADNTQLRQAIQAMLAALLPAGTVVYLARSTAPAGYLKANGAAVSRTTYAALYSAIGTTFGPGDGSTTFNVPDLRGEFLRGWDDGRGVDSGRSFGSAQSNAIQSHQHGQSAQYGTTSGPANFSQGITNASGGTSQPTNNGTGFVGEAETRPRNIALLACIRY